MQKNILAIGIITLFVLSMVSPIVFGYDFKTANKEIIVEKYNFNAYSISEISNSGPHYIYKESNNCDNIETGEIINPEKPTQILDGLKDSPWPMYCNNERHTGRSPYSTINIQGLEKWWFKLDSFVEGSGVIDELGIIYFGSYTGYFYALYPNGLLKWSYDVDGKVRSSPAIDENGIIYVGIDSNHADYRLYALYPNGTAKWKYPATDILSSPVIANDGTIIFADNLAGEIIALYPDGSYRWGFVTNNVVQSDPAINNDIVYCGSHDGALYALYLNNGSLNWKYQTGDWVAMGPSIADDGTIYFGSWDGHLYACYPNGSLKWKTSVSSLTTPVIAEDGTIYVGSDLLTAIYSNNGSVKWIFDVPGRIHGSTPCISAEGTIFCGTRDPGYIVAVNPDGTEIWRKYIGSCLFHPIIAEDGTVYIGSSNDDSSYLHAFGELDSNAPSAPTITGQTSGKTNTEYEYTFKSTSPLGRDVNYYIEWGDGSIKDWFGPYSSSEEVKVTHTFSNQGTYTIKARAKDTDNLWGPWGELEVNMPRDKVFHNTLIYRILEQFPILREVVSRLTNPVR